MLNSPRAWLAVAAAFLASFAVFGLTYSFGAFLKPMAVEFGGGAAAASAFFSITTAVYYSMGAVTGHVAGRLGPRVVVAIGAVVLGGGLCLTAAADALVMALLGFFAIVPLRS